MKEYAFALGAVAHHAADNYGHAIATNRAVPMLFPKLRRRFGDIVTYDDDALSHAKVEFGFGAVQVWRSITIRRTLTTTSSDSKWRSRFWSALSSKIRLKLGDLFLGVDRSPGTYRYAVSSVIPGATKMAWATKRDQIQKSLPGVMERKFIYNLKRLMCNWRR